MPGDNFHVQSQYSKLVSDRTILAAHTSADHANVLVPKSSKHTIYIQRIIVSITTHADQTISFQDGAGTPVVIAALTDEATVVPTVPSSWEWDFGWHGTPLTQGEELDIILSAAGIAARVHIEAYEKVTATLSLSDTQ